MCCREGQEPGAWRLAVVTEQLLLADLCAPRAGAGEGVAGGMAQALADVAEAAAEGAVLVGMDGVAVVLVASATVLTSLVPLQAASKSYIIEAAKQAACRNGCWIAETAPAQVSQHRWNSLLLSLQHCLLGLPGKTCGNYQCRTAFLASQASAKARAHLQPCDETVRRIVACMAVRKCGNPNVTSGRLR